MTQVSKRFPRGKDMKISWLCWQYGHRRCKGRNCKCECHTE